MKKAVLLTLLIVILSVALWVTPICYAATISASNCFYEVTNQDGLQTYLKDDLTFIPSIVIPYTYFFKVTQSPAEGYYKISYNGYEELYVQEATLPQSVRLTTYESSSSFKAGPYYTLPLNAPATALQLYGKNYNADALMICNSLSFIGYANHESEYFFFVKATQTVGGISNDYYMYVKATDVISSTYDPKKIEINPDSQPAKNEETAKDVEKAQNQLRRNIFIIVLCFVCVLSVILIYNPFKKKSQARPVNSITTNDDI